MSTVKTNNVQIGQSVTATNNFTWYQPASPDGTVRLGNGNSGSVTDLVTLTSAGNLGIGTSSPGAKLDVKSQINVTNSGGSSMVLAKATYFGYSSTYGATQIGGTSGTYSTVAIGYDPIVNLSGNFSGYGSEVIFRNGVTFITPNATDTNWYSTLTLKDGNLGLGVTPSAWGSGSTAFQLGNGAIWKSGSRSVDWLVNGYHNGTNYIYNVTAAATYYRQYDGTHQWFNAPSGTAGNAISFTQAMTLDASGQLLVGCTANPGSCALVLSKDSGTTRWQVGPSSAGGVTQFYVTATTASQGVYLASTTATSWTGLSDERYKDIIEPITNAVFKINTLRAVIGKFKDDAIETRRPFLIAQDVQAVLPEAVDATDPDKLGVQYTDTIPLLVAAIKELSAELNELKQKVNA